jgi:hypothetical protein
MPSVPVPLATPEIAQPLIEILIAGVKAAFIMVYRAEEQRVFAAAVAGRVIIKEQVDLVVLFHKRPRLFKKS